MAFSAASFRRCRAILSADRSTPSVFLNSVTSQSMTRWSQSSPPRWVLPEVDLTSNTPSPISRTDTSKVPPPRSNTRIGLVVALLVEPVGERGRGRLVDDAQHLEAGDLARLLGGGALGVVEVGRDGDDGLVDGVAEVGLGVPLQLLQDAGRDLLGVYFLPSMSIVQLVPMWRLTDRMVRSGLVMAWRLATSPTRTSPDLENADDRRRRPAPFGVGDDDRLAGLEDAHDRVGGAEVDSDGLGHCVASVYSAAPVALTREFLSSGLT